MKDKENIILLPFDFTEVAHNALEHAIGVAKTIDHDVYIFHVVNSETKRKLKKEKKTTDHLENELKKIVDKYSETHKVYLKYIIRNGSIFRDIATTAKEIGARFIVMGTHGKKGLQHITGSWAKKVITSAEAPFIVVQQKPYRNGYKNIIFPIDATVESKQKINWAIYIAKTFNSIVHIFVSNEVDKEMATKVQRNTQQIRGFFDKNDIEYIIKVNDVVGGNFAKSVISYANFASADIIMIMTNPTKSFPGFMWGKWDEEVLFNESQIPVMCINPRHFSITVGGR